MQEAKVLLAHTNTGKAKCYFCRKNGHRQANCRKYKQAQICPEDHLSLFSARTADEKARTNAGKSPRLKD